MPDIFLSYSREDQAIARLFAEALKREGFEVWWDQRLHSGDPYDRLTEQALKDSKATVVLWSSHSVDSRWVRAEATMADRRGTLLPVMIGNCDRPLMFELTQAAELTHWKGNVADPEWRSFVADVRRFVSEERTEPALPAPEGPVSGARRQRVSLALLVSGLVLVVGAAAWYLVPRYAGLTAQPAAEHSAHGGPLSIAVLPFVDMTAGGVDAPLGEGLSDEISNWLAQIPQFQVVARTSAFTFKGANPDVREIGRRLGASHVVEGSIRRGSGRVRVTVQLVATSDGYHLWSRTFDLPDADALRIEDSVARSVADALNTRLTDETERRWKARQAQQPQAQDLYLKGEAQRRLRTAEGNLRAQDLFRRAINEDRSFPLAYVSLAETTLIGVQLNGKPLSEAAVEVTTLLDQADALSPDLPESTAARGWLALEQYRLEDAMVLLQRALALNPNDAEALRNLGSVYARMARPRQAGEQYALAAQLDPLDFMTHTRRCLGLQDLAEFVAAEEACARARSLNTTSLYGPLATAYLEFSRGDYGAALQWLDRSLEMAPEDVDLIDNRVWILAELGLADEAARTAARLPAGSTKRNYLNAFLAVVRASDVPVVPAIEAYARDRGQFGMADWLALANLQLVAGDTKAARVSLDRARQLPDWQPLRLSTPDQVRLGTSTATTVAAIDLATGNKPAALQVLDDLERMLDRMEQGGAACAGLYSLRAESRALRGDAEGAMSSLRRAHDKGWRAARAARREPFLQLLRDRPDYRALLADTDRQLAASAASFRSAPR